MSKKKRKKTANGADPFAMASKAIDKFACEVGHFMDYLTRPRCYISGGIAHYDLEERKAAFGRAAEELDKAGYLPINPFHNGVPQTAHFTKHMRKDIAMLLECDYIYMLKGWELSKGAKLELDVASSCGIKVLFQK